MRSRAICLSCQSVPAGCNVCLMAGCSCADFITAHRRGILTSTHWQMPAGRSIQMKSRTQVASSSCSRRHAVHVHAAQTVAPPSSLSTSAPSNGLKFNIAKDVTELIGEIDCCARVAAATCKSVLRALGLASMGSVTPKGLHHLRCAQHASRASHPSDIPL